MGTAESLKHSETSKSISKSASASVLSVSIEDNRDPTSAPSFTFTFSTIGKCLQQRAKQVRRLALRLHCVLRPYRLEVYQEREQSNFVCLWRSVVLRSRFCLSLFVALFLSTLAAANSVPVKMTSLHSANSVLARGYTSLDRFSTNGGKATPAMFGALNNHGLTGAGSYQFTSAHFTDHQTGFVFRGPRYGAVCCSAKNWLGPQGAASSTPEPATLLTLSTGLVGIAGLMRRKLLRG